jgi:hypothetical protein
MNELRAPLKGVEVMKAHRLLKRAAIGGLTISGMVAIFRLAPPTLRYARWRGTFTRDERQQLRANHHPEWRFDGLYEWYASIV